MSVLDTFLWVVLPYLSILVFFGGLIWRYRVDQFGWTSRSSGWNENALLRWASPLFHFGIIFVAFGHMGGLLIPQEWTSAVGISPELYHMAATVLGSGAALMTIVGFLGLLYRRFAVRSIRLATSPSDLVTYFGLTVVIALGTTATVVTQVFGGEHGYNYRETISVWFRSIPLLHPQPELMLDVPLAFKLHIVAAMLLFIVWPFTRLVHVVSAPVGYVGRPYVVYRSREAAPATRQAPRGWR